MALSLFQPKPNTEKDALRLAEDFKQECQNNPRRLPWEYNQHYIVGEQLLYTDTTNNRVTVIRPGVMLPDASGKPKPVPYNVVNYPIDNHLGTLVRDLINRITANDMKLEAGADTNEENDKDAAKVSTYLLHHYIKTLKVKEKLKKGVTSAQATGCYFLKIWYDTTIGDIQGEDPETGKAIRGDLNLIMIPAQAMMLPNGITCWDDKERIGHEQAMSVSKIKKIWGKGVPAETNLRDPKKLTYSASGANEGLKDSAIVREVFEKPNDDYPEGRHVISANGVVLDNQPLDPQLMAQFPNRWHPYIMIPMIEVNGEVWPRSLVDDGVPLQREINKLSKKISDSKPQTKPIVFHQKLAVTDLSKLDLDPPGGLPGCEVNDINGIKIEWPRNYNQDYRQDKQEFIERLNDMFASWPAGRGQPTSNITSDKQAEGYRQGSNTQLTQMLDNIVGGHIELGERVLELLAVHRVTGQLDKIIGTNNETLAQNFNPEQIKPHNISLSNGAAYFMLPDERRRETERLADKGWFGNIQDPAVISKVFKSLDRPAPEGAFDFIQKDTDMARNEGRLFIKGVLQETDPYILQKSFDDYKNSVKEWMMAKQNYDQSLPAWEQFSQNYPIWQNAKEEYNQLMQMASKTGMIPENPGAAPMPPGQPPQDPGPPPEQPKPYRKARYEDNDLIHIQEHESDMKSTDFEKAAMSNPEIRDCFYFHIHDHYQSMAAKVQEKAALQPQPMQQPTQ